MVDFGARALGENHLTVVDCCKTPRRPLNVVSARMQRDAQRTVFAKLRATLPSAAILGNSRALCGEFISLKNAPQGPEPASRTLLRQVEGSSTSDDVRMSRNDDSSSSWLAAALSLKVPRNRPISAKIGQNRPILVKIADFRTSQFWASKSGPILGPKWAIIGFARDFWAILPKWAFRTKYFSNFGKI